MPPTFSAPVLAPITLPDPLLLGPPDPTLRPKRYDPALARAEVMMMLGQLAAAAKRKKGPVRANAAAFQEQIARNGFSQCAAALRLVSQTRINIAGRSLRPREELQGGRPGTGARLVVATRRCGRDAGRRGRAIEDEPSERRAQGGLGQAERNKEIRRIRR